MKRTLFISLAFMASWSQAAIIDNSDGTYSSDGKAYVYFWTPNQANASDLNYGSNWRYLPENSTKGDLSGPQGTFYPNSTDLAMIGYDYDATTGKFQLAATSTTTKFADSWRGKSGIWLGNVTIAGGNVYDVDNTETSLTLNIAKDADVVINGPIGWKTDTTTLNFGDVTGSDAKITHSGGAIWGMQNLVVNASLTMSGSETTITRVLMSCGGFRDAAPTSVTGNISVTGLNGEALTMRDGYVTSVNELNAGECALMFANNSISIVALIGELHWRGTGRGNWSDNVWAATANGTGNLEYSNKVPVYFGNNGTVEINVDSEVNPTSMTISGGVYKFTGDNSPLDNTDTLTISGGTAEFTMNINTASTSVSEGASLTAQALGVENKLTVGGTVEAASVTAGSIDINTGGSLDVAGDIVISTSLQMNAGNLSANQLTGNNGSVTINAGKVELTNGSTAASTTIKDGVTLSGTTSLSGENVKIGNVIIEEADAEVSISGTTLASGATVKGGTLTISDATLGNAITVTSGTLVLAGNMEISDTWIGEIGETTSYSTDGKTVTSDAEYGYKRINTVYTIVSTDNLNNVNTDNATWANGITYVKDEGKAYRVGTIDTSTYYINGSTLIINEKYTKETTKLSSAGGTVELTSTGELSRNDIAPDSGTLKLTGDGTYHTNGSYSLGSAVELTDTWTGTVNTGNLEDGNPLNISGLSNENSDIVLGKIKAQNILLSSRTRAASQKAKSVSAGDMVLTSGPSVLDAGEVTIKSLTLGTATEKATLEVSGSLKILEGNITLGNEGSSLTAQSLSDTTQDLNFVMHNNLLSELGTETVVLTLAEAADDVTLTLNNAYKVADDKFSYSIDWDSEGKQAIITAAFNESYYTGAAESENGTAGAAIITAMVSDRNPQVTAPDSDLAHILDNMDKLLDTKQTSAADSLMSAVAGASTAAMGAALSGDMHRQLRAIRNRTTTMGVNQSVVNADMPYFNAWINAEANHAELGADGTDSGYTLDMGGGTVGFDVDFSPKFTAGMAFTAMYGDFTAESEDKAEGDLNAYYLTVFARHADNRWTHTFVASVGMGETSLERTVSYNADKYSTKGDSDGFSIGAMYEVGYVYALDEDATACLQPMLNFTFTHSSVGGYTESGSDAALEVGDMDMTTFTIGAGARIQAAVGENIYNRSSIVEARALVKLHAGDTNCEGDVAFASLPGTKASIKAADMGSVSAEIGAGLTIPLMDDNSAIFFDAALEISSGYTNVNATAGYRYNF